MYQAVQGDVGKGILEMPPATVIITVNTTWSAALISRKSALWVSPESWCPSQAISFCDSPLAPLAGCFHTISFLFAYVPLLSLA